MKGARPALKAVAGARKRLPPLPSTLPKNMASDWRKTCADLIGRELLTDAMLPMVETYVGALWMARKCREAIEQHGVLVGTKGGDAVKPNPAAAMLAKAQEIVARLGDDLGISAVARNRPGIRAAEKSPHDDDAAALGL